MIKMRLTDVAELVQMLRVIHNESEHRHMLLCLRVYSGKNN